MSENSSHRAKVAMQLAAGPVLFAAGSVVLRLNPFWRLESSSGVIDHRAYVCSAFGHLIVALGIFITITAAAIDVLLVASRHMRSKNFYWAMVSLCVGVIAYWLWSTGPATEYAARFHWESRIGLTEFAIEGSPTHQNNWLWRKIVRWQIEPDLDGYLNIGHRLERTDGDVSITVAKVLPIAIPTAMGSDGEVLRNTELKPGTR